MHHLTLDRKIDCIEQVVDGVLNRYPVRRTPSGRKSRAKYTEEDSIVDQFILEHDCDELNLNGIRHDLKRLVKAGVRIAITPSMHTCKHCSKTLPISEFAKAKRYTFGVKNQCKQCNSKYRSRNYRILPEQIRRVRASKRADYWRNPDKYKKIVRAYRKRTGYRPPERPEEKRRAQWMMANALKRGDLVRPEKCSKCGERKKTDGHHPDYSKPLEIVWLCRKCHLEGHRAND